MCQRNRRRFESGRAEKLLVEIYILSSACLIFSDSANSTSMIFHYTSGLRYNTGYLTIPETKILLKMRSKFVLSVIVVASIAVASIAVVLFLRSTNPTIIVWEPEDGPMLHDDTLAVELVAEGLDSPTSMRFLDDSTLLVLEKNKGQVRVVLDGKILEEPA